ncbi:MAG TPA: GtrA family protein [Candidatus Saccharimonadales bacterium]|nr:GtrA family protein [Candidatus Saccharimonadales bacterium]
MDLSKILVRNSDALVIQFFRYGFVAVAAAIVDTGLLFIFTHYLHWFYLLSATASFLISLILNYLLSTVWVFSRSAYRRHVEIIMFLIIGIVGLGLNLVIIWFFTSAVGLFYLKSKLLALLGVFFWSFFARRRLLSTPDLQTN